MNGSRVEIRSARKHYGQLAALDDLVLNIEPGRFTVLLGPSGSGKSTLLRSVAGIEKLDSGTIRIDDTIVSDGPRLVPAEKRDLAMVFQDYALWPHLTTKQNVAYALKRRRLSAARTNSMVQQTLERVGLDRLGGHYPHELSGGQQQRVALARAVIAEPSLLLFDEPLSNLDADLRERLRVEISTTVRDSGSTAMYITHDQAEAFALADDVGVLKSGQIEQLGTPEQIFTRPQTPFVARFTGLAATFAGTVAHENATLAVVDIGGCFIPGSIIRPIGAGEAAELMIRPTAVSLAATESSNSPEDHHTRLTGIVKDVAYRGRGYDHVVETAHGTLSGVFDTRPYARASRCFVNINPAGCFAFAATDD